MNANMLLDKIVEKGINGFIEDGLSVREILDICGNVCDPKSITIGDAMRIKDVLGLTNDEAAKIFL